MNSSSVGVSGSNNGSIDSTTKAKARTGGNTAEGSEAGNGGKGGKIDASGGGSNNNGGATAGDGGNGGHSGLGGTVFTGAADANTTSINVMNTNLVRVNHH